MASSSPCKRGRPGIKKHVWVLIHIDDDRFKKWWRCSHCLEWAYTGTRKLPGDFTPVPDEQVPPEVHAMVQVPPEA